VTISPAVKAPFSSSPTYRSHPDILLEPPVLAQTCSEDDGNEERYNTVNVTRMKMKHRVMDEDKSMDYGTSSGKRRMSGPNISARVRASAVAL
jgi:hypothetical protein